MNLMNFVKFNLLHVQSSRFFASYASVRLRWGHSVQEFPGNGCFSYHLLATRRTDRLKLETYYTECNYKVFTEKELVSSPAPSPPPGFDPPVPRKDTDKIYIPDPRPQYPCSYLLWQHAPRSFSYSFIVDLLCCVLMTFCAEGKKRKQTHVKSKLRNCSPKMGMRYRCHQVLQFLISLSNGRQENLDVNTTTMNHYYDNAEE